MLTLQSIIIISIIIIAIVLIIQKPTLVEGYKDPIFPNRRKMYSDYYPRSNGSIYGNCIQPYTMFSGLNFAPRAY
jgi:hypothetical protein